MIYAVYQALHEYLLRILTQFNTSLICHTLLYRCREILIFKANREKLLRIRASTYLVMVAVVVEVMMMMVVVTVSPPNSLCYESALLSPRYDIQRWSKCSFIANFYK